MSVERHWGTLAMMDLLKKEPATKEGDERIAMAVTTSPRPQPEAPPTTFARDQIISSQGLLGGKDSEEIPNGEIPKEIKKEKILKESTNTKIPTEITKEKIPKEKKEKARNAPRR